MGSLPNLELAIAQRIGSRPVSRRPRHTKKRRPSSHRDASLASGGEGNLRLWLRLSLRLWLRLRVVLLLMDVLRRAVLFLVDLFLFGCC